MSAKAPAHDWPALPFAPWKDTAATVHLWTQIVGKVRMEKTPWINHGWHVTLYVTPRGLTTGPIPDSNPAGDRSFSIEFDFCDHRLVIATSDERSDFFELAPMTVADFYARTMATLETVGVSVNIHQTPNELVDPIRFSQDTTHKSYDAEAMQRFWRALVQVDRVFTRFRAGFVGKSSPSHFFWGSFDLAVTRFSGRKAPQHPGGFPNLPDAVTQEAYSHEVSSAGFWPGGGPLDEAAFYSYAYPTPEGFGDRPVQPEPAYWDAGSGEFLLPYEAVRTADDPDAALMAFLESTYAAAADLGGWDRAALERAPVRPR